MKPFGFPKKERLYGKKTIDSVFANGKSAFSHPIRAIFVVDSVCENSVFTQAMFVVPKKKFKRAVHRNAIRRQMREAYRLNKQTLAQWCLDNDKQVKVAFIYISSDHLSFEKIQASIVGIIKQVCESEGLP